MSKAIKCDRCKKTFEPNKTRLVRINKMITVTKCNGGETESYEICEECYGYMFVEVKDK